MQKRDHVEKLMDAAQALAVSMRHEPRSRARLRNYVRYLLEDDGLREYEDLAAFLEWYGEKYVFPKVMDMLDESGVKSDTFDKIVEFGPGTGWLIRKLAQLFPKAECSAVDKRRFLYTGNIAVGFYETDLEKQDSITALAEKLALTDRSLIVANQFLHCADYPIRIIDQFEHQKWLVIEVDNDPILPHWGAQMHGFGAKPIGDRDLSRMFEESGKHGLRRTWRSPMPGLVLSLFEPK